jgi:hypothetical protein
MKILKNIIMFLMILQLIILCFFPNVLRFESKYISIVISTGLLILFITVHLLKTKNNREYTIFNKIKMYIFIYFNIVIYYCFWFYFALILILHFSNIGIPVLVAYGFWLILGAYVSSFICLKLYDLKKNNIDKEIVKK